MQLGEEDWWVGGIGNMEMSGEPGENTKPSVPFVILGGQVDGRKRIQARG